MSVMICGQKRAERPYYLEGLGVNIYTCQEFCYAVYHHPLLFMDGAMNQSLVNYIRDEFDMGFVAARLEQRMKGGEKQEDLLLFFMQECDYYTAAELNRLRQTFQSFKRMTAFEYAKKRADYLAQFKQYGRAIAGYEEILEEQGGLADDLSASRVLNNLGACYARIFQFKKAMDAYCRAYEKKRDPDILKKMYHLTLLDPGVFLRERYQPMMTGELMEGWKKEFEGAKEAAKGSEQVRKIRDLFERDPENRLKAAEKLVEEWKQEYRGMA